MITSHILGIAAVASAVLTGCSTPRSVDIDQATTPVDASPMVDSMQIAPGDPSFPPASTATDAAISSSATSDVAPADHPPAASAVDLASPVDVASLQDTLPQDVRSPQDQAPQVPAASGNLVRNGGAEQGLSQWIPRGIHLERYGEGRMPAANPDQGLQLFAGNTFDGLLQDLVIPSAFEPQISAGRAAVTFTGDLGGVGNINVGTHLTVWFYGEFGLIMTTSLSGPTSAERNNVTKLERLQKTTAVPVSTTRMTIEIAMQGGGDMPTGLADNVSVELKSLAPLP